MGGTDGDLAWLTVAGTDFLALRVGGRWHRARPIEQFGSHVRDVDVTNVETISTGNSTTA